MKTSSRFLALFLFALGCFSNLQAQTINQLTPVTAFGQNMDGTIRPGDKPWMDNAFNQRGMSYDPTTGLLVFVDTHSGSGGSMDPRGAIYVLDGSTGTNLSDGFSGDFVLNTNGISGGSYADAPAAVADDGAVYVCNQVVNSVNLPFIIYRWDNILSTNPPLVAFSNNISPAQRYGTSIDIRGAGTNTQIIIGSMPNSTSGTNIVIFTTSDGTNFNANVLGATNVPAPNFNDGIAFGPGNTFWAKRIASPLLFLSFDLAAHTATAIRTLTFPDSDNLGPIAVDITNNLLAAIEEGGGVVSGGPERVRLYDISNTNVAPVLLDAETYIPDNQNATAPPGYLDFGGGKLYAYVVNNGLNAYNVTQGPIPPPTITSAPQATNKVVVGRTVSMTVAAFPSVTYQWQSNGVNIANATNGTLTLVNVQSNYAALYNCVVSNSGGSTNANSRLEVVSSASFYHLNLQWFAAQGAQPYTAGLNGGGTPNQRCIAYNALSNHLYVVARSTSGTSNYNIWVVDASSGNLLYTLKTNGITLGVGGGGIGLVAIGVADDGAIYACNEAPTSGGGNPYNDTFIFRLYRWANADSNTLPVQIYSGDPAINAGFAGSTAVNRWGDNLAVRGSGTNTLILMDNNNANARYVAFLYPTDTTMTNWTQLGLHQLSVGTSIGRLLDYGVGNTFWQKRNATALIQSSFDLASPVDPVPALASYTSFTNTFNSPAIDAVRKVAAGVNIITTPQQIHSLDLYEVSDFTAPLLLAQYNFPPPTGATQNTNAVNGNFITQTLFRGDKVFTIDGNNGIMAFTIASGPPTAPAFLTQPQDVRVMEGGSFTLTSSVDQQSSFRWQFQGAFISGATSQTFTLTNAQLSDAGQYRAVASNIFGVSTSAAATVTVVLPGDQYALTPLWGAEPNTQPYLTNSALQSVPNTRTIAYNKASDRLYVVTRSSATTSNFVVYVLNASNGSIISQLNTNGIYNGGAVGAGGIGLVGIDVADDGSIYICNETPDACGCGVNNTNSPMDSLFRIYRWANDDSNTVPVQVFQGDPGGLLAATRWGDNLAVRGGGTNTELLVDTQIGAYAAVLKPTDEYLTNFVSFPFATVVQTATIGRSLQFGPTNTLWQKRVSTPLRLSSYNLGGQSSSTVASYANFASTIGPVAVDLNRKLLAGIDFNGSASTPDSVALYELSIPNSPLQIARYAFPTNQQANGNFIGQAVFTANRVWALDANNGLMAFDLSGPKVSVTQSGNNVVVTWTTNFPSLVLQSSPTIGVASWTDVTSGITIVNGRYSLTDVGPLGTKFFRLRE